MKTRLMALAAVVTLTACGGASAVDVETPQSTDVVSPTVELNETDEVTSEKEVVDSVFTPAESANIFLELLDQEERDALCMMHDGDPDVLETVLEGSYDDDSPVQADEIVSALGRNCPGSTSTADVSASGLRAANLLLAQIDRDALNGLCDLHEASPSGLIATLESNFESDSPATPAEVVAALDGVCP